MGEELPGFLLFLGGNAEEQPRRAAAIEAAGGVVVASGAADDNAYLEPGTPPRSVLIAIWPSRNAAIAAWPGLAKTIQAGEGLTVLCGACLAEQGIPDLPTKENAVKVISAGPHAYMLIEGSVSEPVAMGRYRDIIFPMIREHGAYYLIYASRTGIDVLHGQWEDQALIVSHWPDAEAARDFWYCDRYQTVAIPTRANAGRFSVTLMMPT